MVQELPVRNHRSCVPDLHSTRAKVSRDLISVSCETSEQTNKFLHCGAERQEEETTCGFSEGGCNSVVSCSLEHGAAAALNTAAAVTGQTATVV